MDFRTRNAKAIPQSDNPDPPRGPLDVDVAVTGGVIRGYRDGPVATFLGIPYGDDTGGANRFRRPQPVKPWTGVRDATRLGQVCPQTVPLDSVELRPDIVAAIAAGYEPLEGRHDRENQGEDCLNLNLWAPLSGADAKLPVMVWLHGGAMTSGSANLKRTDGHNLARRGDVLVVGVNHRLGALGYAHLGAVSKDPDVATAGNNGMLDIVQALQWVRDNIASFGGDPDRVTIFGYSGGGYKASTLLGMPDANGLFHRAIVQSGFNDGAEAGSCAELARHLLGTLGVDTDDIEALRKLPSERIVRAQEELGGVFAGFGPVIDGTVIPAPISQSIQAGATGQVPAMIGYNLEEAAIFVAQLPVYGKLGWDDLPTALRDDCGDRAEEAVAIYRSARPDQDPTRIWDAILSDQRMGAVPAMRLLEAHAAGPERHSWAYISTWTSAILPDIYSAHGIEDTMYFDNSEIVPATHDTPGSAELARRLSDTLVTFARDGRPGSALLPPWPEYELADRATMIFDNMCVVQRDPYAAERAFSMRADA